MSLTAAAPPAPSLARSSLARSLAEWLEMETFCALRLRLVVVAAWLRVYLLPQCIQQQCFLSVIMVLPRPAPPPVTIARSRPIIPPSPG